MAKREAAYRNELFDMKIANSEINKWIKKIDNICKKTIKTPLISSNDYDK